MSTQQLSRTEVIAKAESFGNVTTFDINPQMVVFRFESADAYLRFRAWVTNAGLSYTYSGRYLTASVFTFGVTTETLNRPPVVSEVKAATPEPTTKVGLSPMPADAKAIA